MTVFMHLLRILYRDISTNSLYEIIHFGGILVKEREGTRVESEKVKMSWKKDEKEKLEVLLLIKG